VTATRGGAPRLLEAELAVPAQCELAEGPVWDTDRQLLLWVDILAGHVHTLDPATGTRTMFAAGTPVGAAGLTTAGGLVLALVDGFATADFDGRHVTRLPGLATDPAAVRFNDGKPGPWGDFWAGTMQWRDSGAPGSLYRLSPDGLVTELVPGVACSNGLDWTGDRRKFYYVDTPTGGIDLFDTEPDTGALSHRRRFADIPADAGGPDGLTLDAEGGVWVAVWGGGQVRRYLPDGRLAAVVRLPVSNVTSVAFGGADLGVLFITTAREDLSPAQLLAEPHAGDIFCCVPEVTGRPPHRFAAG
jgi:sugar lactone lactonase YvrE